MTIKRPQNRDVTPVVIVKLIVYFLCTFSGVARVAVLGGGQAGAKGSIRQGRISHIGRLGTCLGRQFNRGGTQNIRNWKKLGKKLYSSTSFTSNPMAILAYLVSKWWEFHFLLPLKVSSFIELRIDAPFAKTLKKGWLLRSLSQKVHQTFKRTVWVSRQTTFVPFAAPSERVGGEE